MPVRQLNEFNDDNFISYILFWTVFVKIHVQFMPCVIPWFYVPSFTTVLRVFAIGYYLKIADSLRFISNAA